ncbi:MAG: hypothetical protein MI863_16545 [Desulfobacterales bacterium]|nr:hypothetical protein [Desulfobacterales bacterium]
MKIENNDSPEVSAQSRSESETGSTVDMVVPSSEGGTGGGTKKNLSAMGTSELKKLGAADLKKLSSSQLNKLNASQLNKLDVGQLKKLTTANQAKLNQAQQRKLGLSIQDAVAVDLSAEGVSKSRSETAGESIASGQEP